MFLIVQLWGGAYSKEIEYKKYTPTMNYDLYHPFNCFVLCKKGSLKKHCTLLIDLKIKTRQISGLTIFAHNNRFYIKAFNKGFKL